MQHEALFHPISYSHAMSTTTCNALNSCGPGCVCADFIASTELCVVMDLAVMSIPLKISLDVTYNYKNKKKKKMKKKKNYRNIIN